MMKTGEHIWGAQRFFEKVMQVVPNVIYVFNQQTQANEYSNRNLAEAIGYSGDEVLLMGDRLMAQICHPDDLPKVAQHFAAICALDDEETAQIEYRVRHRDGHYVWLLSIDAVFDRDADGAVLRHIGTATDITALKNAAAALETANVEIGARAQALQRTNENLEVVTYAATHDLRGPINNIGNLLDLLSDDGHLASPDASAMAQMIRRSCDQAASKIQAIMKATEVRSEPLEPEPLPLDEILERVLENHGVALSTESTVEVDLDRCKIVRFSPFQLESICANLVGNALKFADPDRPSKICIEAWAEGKRAKLSVTDNGIGIDLPNHHEQIFGLFKRLRPDIPGSGIGLYTIRETLLRVGGEVEVFSTPGQGSTFVVDFGEGSAASEN